MHHKMNDKEKAELARAVLLIKENENLRPLCKFLGLLLDESMTKLITAPVESVGNLQGRAQALRELNKLFETMNDNEMTILMKKAMRRA